MRLYVHPHWQGARLGRRLLQAAEAAARRKAAPALWLTAWAGNERALAFYDKAGYARLGTTAYDFGGHSYENVVFARSLRLPA